MLTCQILGEGTLNLKSVKTLESLGDFLHWTAAWRYRMFDFRVLPWQYLTAHSAIAEFWLVCPWKDVTQDTKGLAWHHMTSDSTASRTWELLLPRLFFLDFWFLVLLLFVSQNLFEMKITMPAHKSWRLVLDHLPSSRSNIVSGRWWQGDSLYLLFVACAVVTLYEGVWALEKSSFLPRTLGRHLTLFLFPQHLVCPRNSSWSQCSIWEFQDISPGPPITWPIL